MIKYISISFLILTLAIIIYFYILGRASQNQIQRQYSGGLLQACPSTPNCVCSEYPQDQAHYVLPLDVSTAPLAQGFSLVERVITKLGGEIVDQKNNYLKAIFKSGIFGFTDDFEVRLDPVSQTIHLRSASRVGRSDLGVNKKRIEEFKNEFDTLSGIAT